MVTLYRRVANREGVGFVQYFYMFTKNERQIRIAKSDSNRQTLRVWAILGKPLQPSF